MTRNEEYLKTIMDAIGGDSTKIPPYTINSEDDLKYIAAALEERAANKGKFIVTLTPTWPDFSGTMDKTPEEITAAYNAGQDIEFDIPSLSVKCKAMEFAVSDDIIQAGAIVTYRTGDSHLLIEVLTLTAGSTYDTHIYSLTPAS